jgi:predicted TIM-barrel fold metal-dependent hydrolase
MEIVDAQVGLRYPGERLFNDDRRQWPTFEAKLAVLREAGISRAIACRNEWVGGIMVPELLFRNRMVVEACRASDDMLIPAATSNPQLGQLGCELLRRCREELDMRFVGEMFDSSLGYRWGVPGYYRLLECAIDLRMVPLMHCEDEVAIEIGERYPEGQFLIMHLGTGKAYTAGVLSGEIADHRPRLAAIAPYPNLSLVISGTGIAVAGAIKEAVRTLGADRVLFGSDQSSVDPVIAVMCVRRSGISEEDQAKVFAGNFHRLWEWTGG